MSENNDRFSKITTVKEEPYSAVVEIERPSLAALFEDKSYDEDELNSDEEHIIIDDSSLSEKASQPEIIESEKQETSPDSNEDETNGLEIQSDSLEKKKKKTTPKPIDDGQLFLLNDLFPTDEENDESENSEIESVEPETDLEVKEEPKRTTIQAYVLLDSTDDLFVRGDTTFWKDEGLKMNQLDVGKYELMIDKLEETSLLTFWKNDKKMAQNDPIKIDPGSIIECYPEFE